MRKAMITCYEYNDVWYEPITNGDDVSYEVVSAP